MQNPFTSLGGSSTKGIFAAKFKSNTIVSLTLMFFHQYLRLRVDADFSNCDAPSCRASARSSSCDSFWSRSST